MYDELVKRLRNLPPEAFTFEIMGAMQEAADAIEELSRVAEVNAKRALKWAADAEKATDKPRWIPVTERLPEMHEQVLVCNEDYGETALGFSEVAVWGGSDWICTWDMESRLHCITHWMPLPKPPKEENND